MKIKNLTGRKAGGYTTFGGVWEKGEVKGHQFVLRNKEGRVIPVQSKPAAFWSDGSVKWSFHTADSGQMQEEAELIPISSESIPMPFDAAGIKISQKEDSWLVDNGVLTFQIPVPGCNQKAVSSLAESIYLNGKLLANRIFPVFELEHRYKKGNIRISEVQPDCGEILSVEVEEDGPLQAIICFHGNHMAEGDVNFPFVIRMYIGYKIQNLRFQHTFLYDGIMERDFLKGMGIRFELPMRGEMYERHIQYTTGDAPFHECAMIVTSSYPRLSPEVIRKQLAGDCSEFLQDPIISWAVERLPIWQDYCLYQDTSYHYAITKRTMEDCCEITCREGKRAPGMMAVSHPEGSVCLGIRDFWQKYPSGLEVSGLGKETGHATAWFYCPKKEAFDFRHYDKRSYQLTCYEGFENVDAWAEGIGVTSECTVHFDEQLQRTEDLDELAEQIQKPAVFTADPEYYHKKKAFGYWGLKQEGNPAAAWLEEQLDKLFCFYKEEVENRDWYGLFNYGDIMHTYDGVRHCWKYDVGGYAWQNTELVPTYWLGLYFLRSGREDVFTLMEAMSRHCSEVDVYHFGRFKGMGSRHNVRHWGCSCKEPRISMAGHHRFLYYLTGDHRLRDVFDDMKDSDFAMEVLEHSREKLEDGSEAIIVRSGPDWSSFVSNWMMQYELTGDDKWRQKILQGVKDISNAPFGLASGPDYYYDAPSGHLIYHGEMEDTPNQHLQICMGGPQIWLETADLIEDDRLNKLLADLGAFYYIDREEKIRRTGGLITKRRFGGPMFITGVAGYSAMVNRDKKLAELTWGILLNKMFEICGKEGIQPTEYWKNREGEKRTEIPRISTNFSAQWCLNVMMCLAFIADYLPDDLEEFMRMGELQIDLDAI